MSPGQYEEMRDQNLVLGGGLGGTGVAMGDIILKRHENFLPAFQFHPFKEIL